MQQQQIQVQRKHHEESLGKMKVSYRLLQQWVDQDMVAFQAEQARQTAQQTQSLRDTLQKGIADVITVQLTSVWTELTALQTHAIDVDVLAA